MAPPDVFSALANPTRRALLDLLRDQPRTVNDLAARFDMRRPSVSEHLRTLREAGLVDVDKRGRERLYRLAPGPLEEVAAWLDPYEAFWRDRLRGLRDHLDDQDRP
jgi:DNA-binding transcriptional ArsR family regulator